MAVCASGTFGPTTDLLSILSTSTASCFPETALVFAETRSDNGRTSATTEPRAIHEIAVGDRVLALDAAGVPVLSTVYYIPHDSDPTAAVRFLRVAHEPVDHRPHKVGDRSGIDGLFLVALLVIPSLSLSY